MLDETLSLNSCIVLDKMDEGNFLHNIINPMAKYLYFQNKKTKLLYILLGTILGI